MRIVSEAQSVGEPLVASTPTTNRSTTSAAQWLNRGGRSWTSTLGTGRTISWGWRASPPSYQNYVVNGVTHANYQSPSFQAFTAQQQAASLRAVAAINDVSGIQLAQASTGLTNNATILFGSFTQGQSFAHGYFPHPNGTGTQYSNGDIWTNTTYANNSTNLNLNQYGLQTLIHEIGHAVGLEHPGAYDASQGQFTYDNNAEYVQDSRQYTVMSYFEASNTGANHVYNGTTIYSSTLLMHDIAALQRLYGVRSSRTGNTVYGFNSNANLDGYRISGSTTQRVFCIWDSAGIDTMDFSGYSNNQRINLNAETFSDVGALTRNVSIARGAVIENAKGGSGNDTIIGNSAANEMQGNGGNDNITGNGSTDTAVFRGNRSQYTITNLGGGRFRVTDNQAGRDGIDTLTSVERARFSDQTVTLTGAPDPDPDPVGRAPRITLGYQAGELLGSRSQALSTLFRISDPDNDVTRVAVRDGGSGLGRIYRGNTQLGSRTWHFMTLSQFNQLIYRGRGQGTEGLQVVAYDSGNRSSNFGSQTMHTGDFLNNASTKGFIRNNRTVRGTLQWVQGGGADNTDWYRARLEAGTYRITLRGLASGRGSLVDPYLRFRNTAGVQIAFDDDSGVGRDSELIVTITQAGDYFIEVDAYGTTTRGTYQLQIRSSAGGITSGAGEDGDKDVGTATAHNPDSGLCTCAACSGTLLAPKNLVADDPSDSGAPETALVDCAIGAGGSNVGNSGVARVASTGVDPAPSTDSGAVDCDLNSKSQIAARTASEWASRVDVNSMARIGGGLAGSEGLLTEERRSHPFAPMLAA